jgi:hypothetical protein
VLQIAAQCPGGPLIVPCGEPEGEQAHYTDHQAAGAHGTDAEVTHRGENRDQDQDEHAQDGHHHR